MEAQITVAVITTVGAIIAALITAGGTKLLEQSKGADTGTDTERAKKKRRRILAAVAYVFSLLLAVALGFWVWAVVYEGTPARLRRALPDIPGYKKQIYADSGFGFLVPQRWDVEDYAVRFGGGGEVVVVRDRDGEFETQSMKFNLANIPAHHWSDVNSEFAHVRARLQRDCSKWGEGEGSIGNGLQAKRFTCTRSVAIGEQKYVVDLITYWRQLARCVRLKVEIRSELHDNTARRQFDEEQVRVLEYIRLDEEKILENWRRAGC